jgi:FkbM family methyltransferase
VISRLVRLIVRKVFRAAGLDVRRIGSGSTVETRSSLPQALEHIRSLGFAPCTVIDVGAAYGSFTRLCREVFPDARYFLIEPLDEYRPLLEQLKRSVPSVHYTMAAASDHEGELAINVHPDLVGSSLYREVETGTGVNGVARAVRGVTVDKVIREAGAAGPFLLKLDVQGAEVDALKGAEQMLLESECVILEVSFFKFFQDAPECADTIAYMKDRGFVPYDIVGLQYRPLDRALSQVDILFVKSEGRFRRDHGYATAEQRHAQNERMQQYLDHLFAGQHHE